MTDQGVAAPSRIEQLGRNAPKALFVKAPGMPAAETAQLSIISARIARRICPKISGRAAEGIKPFSGHGYYGVKWDVPYIWYQNQGTSPFTMLSLAGKTIPMWIDDPTGSVKRENPKADTRITVNGRRQVKIFRKAAKIGARKKVANRDSQGRLMGWRDVPQSYPGAPGRINRRSDDTGQISKLLPRPHVGVRWRHPGIVPREFLQHSLQTVGAHAGISDLTVFASYGRAR